tara:strand:+ start:371 stop:532 length:162 start_codon:yes stop_codon:yes gene_type:complete
LFACYRDIKKSLFLNGNMVGIDFKVSQACPMIAPMHLMLRLLRNTVFPASEKL